MRRRLAEGLAVLLSVASLGAGAASGPSSLEAAKVTHPPVSATSGHKTRKPNTPKSKAYQIGTASWYGEQFQGKQTASGEPFDMRDFTAAHPSLKLGTFVKVTNLRNGKAVVVRINDRGPVGPLPAHGRGAAATRSQPQLKPIHSATESQIWTRASVSSLPSTYPRPR